MASSYSTLTAIGPGFWARASRGDVVSTVFVLVLFALTVGVLAASGGSTATVLGAVLGLLIFAAVVRIAFSSLAAITAVLIVFSFLATPAIIPEYFSLGVVAVAPYQLVMCAAVVSALASLRDKSGYRCRRLVLVAVLLVTLPIVYGIVVGLLRGYDRFMVLEDVRPLIDLAAGVIIGGAYVSKHRLSSLFVPVAVTLWVSTVLIFFATTGTLEIAGRTEVVALYSGSGGRLTAGEGVRVLTRTTSLALATICAVFCMTILRRIKLIPALTLIVPALLICLLGFSRNHLVAFGCAILFSVVAVFAYRQSRSAVAGVVSVLSVAICISLAVVVATFASPTVANWVSVQASSYESRVLAGISSGVRTRDSSVRDRDQESSYLVVGIAKYGLVGSGLGYAYKPASAGVGDFAANAGQRYAHNFYLWAWLKTGIVGMLSFVVLLIIGLWRSLNTSRMVDGVVLGSVVAMASGASFVAPYPLGYPTSLLLGLVIGGAWVLPRLSKARGSTSGVVTQTDGLRPPKAEVR